MTATARGRCTGEDGFLTVQYLLGTGLSLVLLTVIANLIVLQYGRGVVRAALDEGVRTGSRAAASVGECEARAGRALSDLLGGRMGRGVAVHCATDGDLVVATADVTFPAWIPALPDWTFQLRATAVQERAP